MGNAKFYGWNGRYWVFLQLKTKTPGVINPRAFSLTSKENSSRNIRILQAVGWTARIPCRAVRLHRAGMLILN